MNVFKTTWLTYIKIQYQRSFFYGALLWWWRTLLTLLPARYKARLDAQRPTLLFCVKDQQLHCVYQHAGKQDMLASMPFTYDSLANYDWQLLTDSLDSTNIPFILVIDYQYIFHNSFVFPADTEENLDTLFAYDFDRLTPFSASDVYYDYQVTAYDRKKDMITVSLWLAKREVVDDMVNTVNVSGIALHGIDGMQDDEIAGYIKNQGFNLLPKQQRYPLSQRSWWTNIALTSLVVVAISSMQFYALQLKQERVKHYNAELTLLRTASVGVVDLKKQLKALEEASSFVEEKKANAQSLTKVVYHLTKHIPDNSYLQQLYIKGSDVELQGLSSSAASLIPLLEATPWFKQVTFRSPISQDANTNKERYKIKMAVELAAVNASLNINTTTKPDHDTHHQLNANATVNQTVTMTPVTDSGSVE